MNRSFSYFQPWSSTLQAPLLYLWWSPSCTGWCWHHLCAVVRARQVRGGSGTCQRSRLSYSPEVYGWVHAASAPSTHRPVTQHHRPPLHRSAGPWARPVVSRSVPLDRSYILFFSVFVWEYEDVDMFLFRSTQVTSMSKGLSACPRYVDRLVLNYDKKEVFPQPVLLLYISAHNIKTM